MSEENTETPSQQPGSSNSEQSPSLEDLYGEFKPQETQPSQSTQQTQQSDVKSQASYTIPDPVSDAEGFKSYMGNLNNELAAARSEASAVKAELERERQHLTEQAEEREFRSAAEEIAKKADIDDPDLVEAGLLHKFIKDSNFQSMWQNRNSNPAAFNKVKGVLTQQMREKFAVKVNEQIAENQRAAEEATKNASQGKQKEESPDDKLMGLSGAEFDRAIAQLIRD